MQQNLKKAFFILSAVFAVVVARVPVSSSTMNGKGRRRDTFRNQIRGPAKVGGGGGCPMSPPRNFKTFRVVGVYTCLSLIVGFAVTVAIWPREVVSCRDFMLRPVVTF